MPEGTSKTRAPLPRNVPMITASIRPSGRIDMPFGPKNAASAGSRGSTRPSAFSVMSGARPAARAAASGRSRTLALA